MLRAMTPRALVLAGPTASGKSALALRLAEHIDLEIVSVDSAQVYRGMDIGTAKPSPADRALVPHHLIDIVDPTDRYTAAQFAADAARLIGEINRRNRIPLLAGGTMLYFKALTEGLNTLPPADPGVRASIDSRAAAAGWPALHRELAGVDAATAARLDPNDRQRIQRALEVFELTGRPMSGILEGSARERDTSASFLRIALIPSDRAVLHQRIAERFGAILAAGLVDELRALRKRFALTPDLPSMRAVGYRQAWRHLEGEYNVATLRDRGIFATRQLAKRQLTWLRATEAQVFDPLAPGSHGTVADFIGAHIRAEKRA
jgi:tRNA dimethylallyltransferase